MTVPSVQSSASRVMSGGSADDAGGCGSGSCSGCGAALVERILPLLARTHRSACL